MSTYCTVVADTEYESKEDFNKAVNWLEDFGMEGDFYATTADENENGN